MAGMDRKRLTNLANMPSVADETQAYRLVGIFRRPQSPCYIGDGVGCTSPGSGGVESGCTGSGGGVLGLVAIIVSPW